VAELDLRPPGLTPPAVMFEEDFDDSFGIQAAAGQRAGEGECRVVTVSTADRGGPGTGKRLGGANSLRRARSSGRRLGVRPLVRSRAADWGES